MRLAPLRPNGIDKLDARPRIVTDDAAFAYVPHNSLVTVATPLTHLSLSSGNTSATAGNPITETGMVTDAGGFPVADGTVVDFGVTGINATSGSATTTNRQAPFTYTGIFVGTDMLEATADGGTNAHDMATITWVAPASSPRVSPMITNCLSLQANARIVSGASGSPPTGTFSYQDRTVRLSQVQFQSLVVTRDTASVYATATLPDGTSVSFRLAASQRVAGGQVRLRLSNGYDSGWRPVMLVTIGTSDGFGFFF